MVCAQEHTMKIGLNHAIRVTVAALSIVLWLGAAVPAAAQCPGDLTGNEAIDGNDLGALLSAWGTSGGEFGGDVNGDGVVNGADLAIILSSWGPCPQTGPAVTFEWEILPLQQWCNCEGGCVKPDGLCEPVQRFRADSSGKIVNLSICDFPPTDLGELVVEQNQVQFAGPLWSASGRLACTPDCCSTCGWCFMGHPDFRVYQRLTFDVPVWCTLPCDASGDAGSPHTEYELYGQSLSFRFTSKRSDFNADGLIAGDDLVVILSLWGMPQWRRADLNDDASIDGADLALLFSEWGPVN